MTTYTARFPTIGRTMTRESERRYTHAAAHNDGAGRISFHTSYDAARRAVGRYGIVVRTERS
jgi:hypothetical protein